MQSSFEIFLIFAIMYVLLSWPVYLPYRAGQIYLGPVYCMLGAAYFVGFVTRDLNWPIWLALVTAPVAGGVLAFIPGLGLRRAPGLAVAIASLSLVFILQTVILNTDALGAKVGFFGIPVLRAILPVSIAGLVVAFFIVRRIEKSIIGRSAEATFHSHDLAACCGLSPGNIGLFLQTVSGMLAGFAGAIFAFQVGSLFATAFGFAMLLNTVVIVFAGGAATMWGVLILAPIIWGFPLILPEAVADWKDVIYGVALAAIMIFRPEGLITKTTVRAIASRLTLKPRRSA
ncbi:MAG: branched-chain amino acid ABC transporter permease [Rhodospirillaceae bacterium]|nr:branched-chain amino acid ABC transporter permease [Rhodospirillaceae bacterium]